MTIFMNASELPQDANVRIPGNNSNIYFIQKYDVHNNHPRTLVENEKLLMHTLHNVIDGKLDYYVNDTTSLEWVIDEKELYEYLKRKLDEKDNTSDIR